MVKPKRVSLEEEGWATAEESRQHLAIAVVYAKATGTESYRRHAASFFRQIHPHGAWNLGEEW